MKRLFLLLFAALFAMAASSRATGFSWEIQRLEGRDFVSAQSVAAFYDLPAPPPLTEPAPTDPPLSITLDSAKRQMTLTAKSRAARFNGVQQWLAFPVLFHEGKLWISRLDVSRTVEPRFRPAMVKGFEPVTTVVVDPGHGGHDRGTTSKLGAEKNYALDVCLRMRPLLEKAGYKVVLTRATDAFIPLSKRPAVANAIRESIFVAVHFNGAGWRPGASGFEIFSISPRGAPSTDQAKPALSDLRAEPGHALEMPSAVLAGTVYHSMLGHMPLVDRGIKHARFAVLRRCERPAILVEGGFLSNPEEAAEVNKPEWREKLAEAIVDGIEQYKILAETGLAPKVVADYRKNETAPQ